MKGGLAFYGIKMMKRFFIVVMVGMLSACKSVMFSDLNMQMPNANLLPPLEAKVDTASVRDSFDVKYSGKSTRSYYNYGENWSGGVDSINMTRKRDRSTRDMVTLFTRNIANISQQYGERKGTIQLRVTNSSSYNSGWYFTVPSLLSLHTLNVLGMPYQYKNADLETEVSIYDRKGNLVWQTTVVGHGEETVAVYYGYNEDDAQALSNIKAMKDAMRQVNMNIANDFQMIQKGLK